MSTCCQCQSPLKKLISPSSFHLKGSGWYVTDYPSDARKKGMEGDKPAPAAGGAAAKKDDAGVEKKPTAAEKAQTAAEKKPAAAESKAGTPSPKTGGKSEVKRKR